MNLIPRRPLEHDTLNLTTLTPSNHSKTMFTAKAATLRDSNGRFRNEAIVAAYIFVAPKHGMEGIEA